VLFRSTRIQYECDHVYGDILQLRAELIPLRVRQAQLEEFLSEIDNRRIVCNRCFHPTARQSPWPRVEHKNTSDLLRAQREKEAASQERVKLRDLIEPEGNESLADGIQRFLVQIRALRVQVKENEEELLRIRSEICEMKTSRISQEVDRQNLQIERAEKQIEEQIRIRDNMKGEIAGLEIRSYELTQEMIDAAGENPKLVRRFNQVTKWKQQKAQKLAQLTNDQEEEIILQRLKDERKIERAKSLFVGWLDSEFVIENVRDLVENPDTIQSISIQFRQHRDAELCCAYLNFESHEMAKDAMMEIKQRDYDGKKYMVLWNDEQIPTPPAEPPPNHVARGRCKVRRKSHSD
jgi:hypothetical protein